MATYGTKYTLTFYDYYDNQWILNLKKKSYSSTVYTIAGGETPVIISDPNEGSGKLIPIRGSEMQIQLFVDLSSITYDFQDDFFDIDDREWLAELNEASGTGYEKTLSITNLNITNTGNDATATIQITNAGNLVFEPECEYVLGVFQIDSGETFNFYAVPANDDANSPDRKLLATYTIQPGDATVEDVIDGIVSTDADLTKVNSTTFKWKQTTFDADIDNTWNIKATFSGTLLKEGEAVKFYKEDPSIKFLRFNGSTVKAFIAIDWFSLSKTGGSATVAQIAKREFSSGETVNQVAADLQGQIDGSTQQNVFLQPTDDDPVDIELSATVSTDTITITLEGLFADGNGIELKDSQNNETFIRVHTNAGSTYTWTDTDFSGGDSGGDEFKVQFFVGGGDLNIASTRAYTGDSIGDVMSRLNQKLQIWNSWFKSELNGSNQIEISSTQDFSSYDVRFTTDGGSTTDPSTYEAFDTVTLISTYFQGWVLPQIYSQPHQAGLELVELSAVCGLGDLKNFTFEINDSRPFEKKTFIEIISIVIQKTGFNLGIKESFDLFPDNGNTTDSGLLQVYQDTSRLNGRDCYSVLKEIVQLAKASIYQYKNFWVLSPLNLLNNSYNERIYDFYGNLLTTEERSGFVKSVGGTSRTLNYLNRSANIVFEPAFKRINFLEDYGFVSQLFKFPAFSTINDNLDNLEYPWDWIYNGTTRESQGKISLQDGVLRIEENSSQQHVLQQVFNIADLAVADTNDTQFELSVRYLQSTRSLAADNFQIKAKAVADSTTVWLRDNEQDPWVGTEQAITLTANENNKSKTFNLQFDFPGDFSNTVEEAEFTFQILQPTSGYIEIESVELKANSVVTSGVRKKSFLTELVDDISSDEFEQTFTLLDVPNIANAKELFKNALYIYNDTDEDYELTNFWNTNPDTYKNTLLGHLRLLYLTEYPRPIKRINAEILGDCDLRTIFHDLSMQNTPLFYLTGGDFDVKKRIVSGELEEYQPFSYNPGDGKVDDNYTGDKYTLRTVTQSFEEESSGTNSYTTIPGDSGGDDNGGGQDIDLSNYVTNSELENAIIGRDGSFTYSQLTNGEIDIYHNLGRRDVILFIWDKNNNAINPRNFDYDTSNSINYLTLNLRYPGSGSDTFTYRIL
jgi:hypothetical protein